MELSVEEDEITKGHADREPRGRAEGFGVGDNVEGNYFMESTFPSCRGRPR